ncbi:hypothetical protein [Roseobacter weihaiensis]|uniref:hypothetical protein n=1 Tax=Roseobacter weihaiensis TaxID=2763262 RepID=UPI001D0AFE0E|nr:hypothetical protein [Roseobacter sp. H9]
MPLPSRFGHPAWSLVLFASLAMDPFLFRLAEEAGSAARVVLAAGPVAVSDLVWAVSGSAPDEAVQVRGEEREPVL